MQRDTATNLLESLSRAIFGIIAVILLLLALVLAGYGVFEFMRAAWTGRDVGLAALTGIGYTVVAVATFEIAKYLIEEEVIRGREMRVASEARRSLTRFISIIAIATFLEALVTVFRVSKDNVPHLIYPTLLLIAGIMLILGLGIYQRLSATVEEKVEEKDLAEEHAESTGAVKRQSGKAAGRG